MPTFRLRDGTGSVRLRYLVEDVDRHGNVRLYVRRPGVAKVRLHETPGTDAFMAEYRAALAGQNTCPGRAGSRNSKIGGGAEKGSLRWLTQQYFASAEFRLLAPATQVMRRRTLETLCQTPDKTGKSLLGDKPFALLETRHVRAMRDAKSATPDAANTFVKVLRQMFAWAIGAALADKNPGRDVPKLRSANPDGHHSWTNADIAAFEAKHPVGTKARLAMALFLYTGQRRSDIVLMGPQHIKDGYLTLTQQKNRQTKPVRLQLPVLPELQAIIDATPIAKQHLTFLTTEFGRPFTTNGFGSKFRDWCDQAGLHHCSAHGLRKAMAAQLAESGAGENEIMAWTGHQTSYEVTRYTKGARQRVLADRAAERLTEHKPNKTVPPKTPLKKSGEF